MKKGCFILGAIAGSAIGMAAAICMMPYYEPKVKKAIKRGRRMLRCKVMKML